MPTSGICANPALIPFSVYRWSALVCCGRRDGVASFYCDIMLIRRHKLPLLTSIPRLIIFSHSSALNACLILMVRRFMVHRCAVAEWNYRETSTQAMLISLMGGLLPIPYRPALYANPHNIFSLWNLDCTVVYCTHTKMNSDLVFIASMCLLFTFLGCPWKTSVCDIPQNEATDSRSYKAV